MNLLDTISCEFVYLNTSQNQIYTVQKITTLLTKWTAQLESNEIELSVFNRLYESHFKNLKQLPKYETINNKKHSIQCSYATDCNCKCWCIGKYHGRMLLLVREIVS